MGTFKTVNTHLDILEMNTKCANLFIKFGNIS